MKIRNLFEWWKNMPLDVFFRKAFWCIIGLSVTGLFLGMITLKAPLCILFGGFLLTAILLYMDM